MFLGMNKLFSFIIACLVLVQSLNIPLADIVELDKLIVHAQFHAEQYGDDFSMFLSKHYGALKADHSQKHQEEKKEHESLPFQNQLHTVTLSAFVIDHFHMEATHIEFSMIQQRCGFFYSATYPSMEKESPFQPPRFA